LIEYEDTCDCLVMVKQGYIEDEPAFPYRGLMIGKLSDNNNIKQFKPSYY